jgi:hypothetical protein
MQRTMAFSSPIIDHYNILHLFYLPTSPQSIRPLKVEAMKQENNCRRTWHGKPPQILNALKGKFGFG